ncbi:MAG: RNA polymerase sigma factor [bacterium]
MLKLWKPKSVPFDHEEMFVARYEGLLACALQLTDRDRARAEDLLHETFIEFTLSRPDLAAIENPDGYLRQVLRNIHLSEFRKSTRQALCTISIAEYDSVSLGLRQLEERQYPGGQIIARRRLEVWRSTARGLQAARLSDGKGDLMAGEWQQADGSRTLYHRGKAPQVEQSIRNPQSAIRRSGDSACQRRILSR